MTWRVATLLAALGAAIPAARAQLDVGPEFQVNAYTAGRQRFSAVAVHDDGSFVVAWTSGSMYTPPDPPDDSAAGVFLQRFDATGARLSAEQHVNTFTLDDEMVPDVSVLADGGFVVVWESGCYYGRPDCGPDGSRGAVALQRFDAEGARDGGELVVNTFTPGWQLDAAVASTPTGEFVVTWASSSYTYPTPGRDPDGVFARRFAADGTPAGDEQQVNLLATNGLQGRPDVAMDAAGNFVVVWWDYYAYTSRIRGARFDASGAPLSEVLVTSEPGYVSSPAVAATLDGFVVVWGAQYSDPLRQGDIRARRFAPDGAPLGPVFAVNTYVHGNQYAPDVAADASGNFVVTWGSYDYFAISHEHDTSGIFAQAFAHDGAPLGSEFQVNAFTIGLQNEPAVAANATGEFVIGWSSTPRYGDDAQDGDRSGVFARRLALHPCGSAGDCDDANPCTADACEGGVCLNRRQAGCCRSAAECGDGDACTDDVCTGTVCTNPAIADCVPCVFAAECGTHDACTTVACLTDLGRCEFIPVAGCCLDATACDDGLACTEDTCGANHECNAMPIAGCVPCVDSIVCASDCLIAPPTCTAGRCADRPASCPIVTLDPSDPLGASGRLLARIDIPAELPGKGKIKAVMTGAIGALDATDEPSRRCRSGQEVGRVRTTLTPGSATNALLAFTKAGARCLAADPDGALPVDVTVRIRRKKTPLTERVETRIWRR